MVIRSEHSSFVCSAYSLDLIAQIWQGSHKAAHPIWSNNQNFQCVLTIADPRFPDKKLGWLDKGDGGDDDNKELDHLRIEAEVGFHRVLCTCEPKYVTQGSTEAIYCVIHLPRGATLNNVLTTSALVCPLDTLSI